MFEYPLCNVSTGLLMTCISFSAAKSRFVLPISCEYGVPLGRARSCLCRLRRHISRAAISTSRANPTAPIAMPTLALVLRLLELLEVPKTIVLLAGNGEVVDVGIDAADVVAIGTAPPGKFDEADVEILADSDFEFVGAMSPSLVTST